MLHRSSCRPVYWHCVEPNDRAQNGQGRPEMMPIIGLLVGAAVGLWLGHNFEALLGGGFVGLVAGLLINASKKRSTKPTPFAANVDATRFAALEERVARVEAALERAGLAQPAQTIAPLAASAPPPAGRARPFR